MYSPMALQLSTPRLRLRPLADGDVALYREMITERGEPMPSVDEARARIARQHAAAAEHGFALLAAEDRASGGFLGYCGIIVGRASAEEPEIAYELLRRFHRKGFATEAARAVIDAIALTGRSRLWSTVRTWNAPSLRVLDKVGFVRSHTTRDEKGDVVWLTRALH